MSALFQRFYNVSFIASERAVEADKCQSTLKAKESKQTREREKIGRRMDKSTKAAKIDRRRRASKIPSS